MPPINAMQANAGFMPYGAPELPPLVFPMGAPQYAPSPGQVSGMLQQQMYAQQYAAPMPSPMMGGTMMQSPFRGGFGGPPSMFGRANLARQAGISSAGTLLGGAEAGVSALSMAARAIPVVGVPIGLGIEAINSATFGAVNAQRERALALQNQSLGWVTGGGLMSQTGQGMGMQQARMITQGLGTMADSASFKQQTGGMLNRADLDRLTRIAGETGMLNNTQSPQQVLDAVRKISKQVTTFMSVIEEPDFQKAMQRMGQMHQMGVRVGDMSTVGANARTFARMAGVTADQALDTAMQHSSMFQARGLSAANGINASLGAQGFGRQIANVLDPRTLSLMGGAAGITNGLMETTTNTFSNPLLMAAVLRRGHGGHLEASGADLMRAISGPNASISDITRRGASNMRGLGGTRTTIAEVMANRGHLQDQLMDGMSPEQMMLINIRMAQLQQRQAGGSLEENVMRMTGSEEQTRALMTLVRDPRALAGVRDQARIAARDRAVGRRDRELEDQSHWAQRAWDSNIADPLSHTFGGITASMGRWAARNQERTESLALQGNGRARALDGDNMATEVFTAGVRGYVDDMFAGRTRRGQRAEVAAIVNRGVNAENERNAASFAGSLGGANGFGFTAAQRGGDSFRQVVLDGGSTMDRFRDSFVGRVGNAMHLVDDAASVAQVQRMAASQQSLADTVARGTGADARSGYEKALGLFGEGDSNRQRALSALAAASQGARSYLGSREGWFGTQDSLDQAGLMSAARQSLERSGIRGAEADRLLASSEFQSAIISNVSTGADAETRRQLARATTQGANVRDSIRGQSSADLRRQVQGEHNKVRSMLGLSGGVFGIGEASDATIGSISNVLRSTGENDELRRKIYTAYAMSQSSDSTTKAEGERQLDLLHGEEGFDEVFAQVEAQLRNVAAEELEDLGDSFRGQSFRQATEQTSRVAEHADRAVQRTAEIALRDVIGDSYTGEVTDENFVANLRRDPSQVRSRNIQRMLRDPERYSDEQVRQAIQSEANEKAGAASRSGSVGAGEDAAEGEAATDELVSDIQAGLAAFPETTEKLATAAEELRAASRALQTAVETGSLVGGMARAH